MNSSTRNKVVAGAAVVVALVALGTYLDNQKKKEIARARADYFTMCAQGSYALTESLQQNETSAVIEKAGLDPNLFRLQLINPAEGRAALEKAGLLDDFAAAVERQNKMVAEGKKQQQQCEKKQAAAKDFLTKNNALPTAP